MSELRWSKGDKVFIWRDYLGNPKPHPELATLAEDLGSGLWTLEGVWFTKEDEDFSGYVLDEYDISFSHKDFYPDYLSALNAQISYLIGERDRSLNLQESISELIVRKNRLLSGADDKITLVTLGEKFEY